MIDKEQKLLALPESTERPLGVPVDPVENPETYRHLPYPEKLGFFQRAVAEGAKERGNIPDREFYATARYMTTEASYKDIGPYLGTHHTAAAIRAVHRTLSTLWDNSSESVQASISNDEITSEIKSRGGYRDPSFYARRSEELSNMWRDNREEMIATLHSPESEQKRRDSLKKFLDDHPEALDQRIQNLVQGRETERVNKEQRRVEAFGDDVKTALERWHYGEYLTVEMIVEQTGYSHGFIDGLMKEYGIQNIGLNSRNLTTLLQVYELLPSIWQQPEVMDKLSNNQRYVFERRFLMEGPQPTLEEIGQELNGISRQAVQQLEKKAIKILSKLLTES